MRLSSMPQLGEHFEHLPFEGMVRAGDADLAGEVSEVGSVSWVSLTTSGGNGWNGCWPSESLMEP